MKQIALIPCLTLCLAVSLVDAVVHLTLPSVDPGNPDKCWDKDRDAFYERGFETTVPSCMKVTCNRDLSLTFVTCGTVNVVDCTLKEDLSLPFPDCCPQPICPINDAKRKAEIEGASPKDAK